MRTVRTKIATCMFLLSMFAMAVVLLTVHRSSLNALRTNEIHYNIEATNQTKYTFSYIFDSVYKTVKVLIENPEVSTAMHMRTSLDEDEIASLRNNLSTMLKTSIYPTQAISAVHIIGSQSWSFFSSMPSVDENSLRDTCYSLTSQSDTRLQYMFTGCTSIEYYPGVIKQVIQYITPVYNLQDGQLFGFIVIDIDFGMLEEMFLTYSRKNEDKALIVRENGEIIFNYPYNITLDSVLEDYPQLLSESAQSFDGKVFGADMLIVSDTIDYTNWRIIRMIPSARITKDTQSITALMLKTGILFLFFSLIVSFLLSKILTNPLTKLARAFHDAENGNMEARVAITTRDEMGSLGIMFNSMMSKLNNYFTRELESQKKKSDMELEVLEAQINPHFLYNTLDSIKWLAVLQNVDNIAQMTASLINLLRYNLSKDGPMVTLMQEVDSVENYMRVQRYRYGTGLDLNQNLSPETLNMEMPRFILQPMVENCILHAYAQTDEIGRIEIASEVGEGQLIIRVIDEGCGMAENAELEAEEAEKGRRFKNIGIANIRERIRLYCGSGYGLKYTPRPEGGTIAEIKLPIRNRL